jgi:hypothetical protein
MNETNLSQQSSVHPVIACAMLCVSVLLFLLPRRHLIVPLLSAGILIPMDQIVVVGPFHFPMIRVLVLFAWVRVVSITAGSGKALLGSRMNTVDKLVILFAAFDALDYIVLWQFSAQAFINRFGALFMVIGIYFLLRILIRNDEDILLAIKVLAYVSAVIALTMLIEHVTGQNPYGYLGGSRAWTREALMVRAEKLRAMGPFQHPILAGSFGGVSLPLFIGLWIKRQRFCAVVGIASATIIVFASASSTPIMAYAVSLLAIALWPLRRQMRVIRWGVAICLVSLHLVMKAPVWALIQRIDLVGGSSGFHRYNLIDQFIRRFWDWWVFGVKDTRLWGPDLWDHANQYVAVGTTSGVLPLIMFISIIVFAFKYSGRARRRREDNRRESRFVWTLSAAVLANLVAFFGISYVDQTIVVWWGLLAMIQIVEAIPEKPKNILHAESGFRQLAGSHRDTPAETAIATLSTTYNCPSKHNESHFNYLTKTNR